MKITLNNCDTVFKNLSEKLQVFDTVDADDIKKSINRLKDCINSVSEGGKQLKEQNNILKIGVVGQVKAGKSSFLNSLFFDGENVLPRASTPMTAGLTMIQYGEENSFIVEYYNKKEWQVFEDRAKAYDDIVQEMKGANPSLEMSQIEAMIPEECVAAKELVMNCGRLANGKIQSVAKKEEISFSCIKDLQDVLEKYVGANGDFTSVTKCLTVNLHDDRLKEVQIVDTPGVNDPVLSREQRTREFLRGCHGVFFLSRSGRFFDSTDVLFLTNRIGDQGIGTVVLIASQFDSVLREKSVVDDFKDNLGAAIEDCKCKLNGQYKRNIATSNYKGNDPIFDVSSGIGYSIAKKEPDRRDSTEKHVVEQMKHFYPSFFSTEEDVVSTFFDLSQMDVIRSDYLEGLFTKNKETIIKQKVDSYFANTSENLKKEFEKEIEVFKGRIEALENGDLNSIQEQKEIAETIIKEIKSDIGTTVNRAESAAERFVKESLNEFSFHWGGRVPTTTVERDFHRTSTFWESTRSFKCSYEKVELYQLIDGLSKQLEAALNKLLDVWNSKTSELRKIISERIGQIITENELKDKKGLLNAKMLRNILDEILDSMLSNNTLDVHTMKEKFNDNLNNSLNGMDELSYHKCCCEESEARSQIYAAAEKCKNEVRNAVNSIVSGLHQEVEDALLAAREKSISLFKDRKNDFINGISDKMKEELLQLEKDLKDKTNKLGQLRQVESGLINISKEL